MESDVQFLATELDLLIGRGRRLGAKQNREGLVDQCGDGLPAGDAGLGRCRAHLPGQANLLASTRDRRIRFKAPQSDQAEAPGNRAPFGLVGDDREALAVRQCGQAQAVREILAHGRTPAISASSLRPSSDCQWRLSSATVKASASSPGTVPR